MQNILLDRERRHFVESILELLFDYDDDDDDDVDVIDQTTAVTTLPPLVYTSSIQPINVE